jgi:hypothetical protein
MTPLFPHNGIGIRVIINTFLETTVLWSFCRANLKLLGVHRGSCSPLGTRTRGGWGGTCIAAIVPVFIFSNAEASGGGSNNSYAIFFSIQVNHSTNLFFFQIVDPLVGENGDDSPTPLLLLREHFFPLIGQYPQRRCGRTVRLVLCRACRSQVKISMTFYLHITHPHVLPGKQGDQMSL